MAYTVKVVLKNDELARYNVADSQIDPGDTLPVFTIDEYTVVTHILTRFIRIITRAEIKKVEIELE